MPSAGSAKEKHSRSVGVGGYLIIPSISFFASRLIRSSKSSSLVSSSPKLIATSLTLLPLRHGGEWGMILCVRCWNWNALPETRNVKTMATYNVILLITRVCTLLYFSLLCQAYICIDDECWITHQSDRKMRGCDESSTQ